eukprot:m.245873 g.245873  ORF g.245873 m.245873 type:complete len:156 (-) comp19055_c2_seq1:3482-3949(-)
MSLAEAREKERLFFDGHHELCHLSHDIRGVAALSMRLVALQTERIKATLPEAAIKIGQRVADLEGQLAAMGPQPNTEVQARSLFLQRLQDGLRLLEDELSGAGHSMAMGAWAQQFPPRFFFWEGPLCVSSSILMKTILIQSRRNPPLRFMAFPGR